MDTEIRKMEDWQTGKSIVTSLECALDNNHLCDVQFHFVEEDPVVSLMAHKLVLSFRSPVFQAMFFGPMAGECSKIEITDVDSSAFAELLRYIYTDEAHICEEDVLDVLSASHKYFITGLVRKCSKFLIRTISMTNVCELLEKATLFGVKDLQHHCLVFIDYHTKDVLKTDGFLSLSRSTLERILTANTLHADEFTIYQAVQAWTVAECNRLLLDYTIFENRRALSEPLVNLIRFPLISPQKFSEEIVGNSLSLLTQQEIINLFQIFTRKLSNPHDFFCEPRKEEIALVISRFEEDGRCRFWCQGIEDKFQFTTNIELVLSAIVVKGSIQRCGCFGYMKGSAEILEYNEDETVSLGLRYLDHKQSPLTRSNQHSPAKEILYDILIDFNEFSVFISPGKNYGVHLTIERNLEECDCNEICDCYDVVSNMYPKEVVRAGEVTTTFKNSGEAVVKKVLFNHWR